MVVDTVEGESFRQYALRMFAPVGFNLEFVTARKFVCSSDDSIGILPKRFNQEVDDELAGQLETLLAFSFDEPIRLTLRKTVRTPSALLGIMGGCGPLSIDTHGDSIRFCVEKEFCVQKFKLPAGLVKGESEQILYEYFNHGYEGRGTLHFEEVFDQGCIYVFTEKDNERFIQDICGNLIKYKKLGMP